MNTFLLQRDREEPDTKSAMLVTAESDLLDDDERYNPIVQVSLIQYTFESDVKVCIQNFRIC